MSKTVPYTIAGSLFSFCLGVTLTVGGYKGSLTNLITLASLAAIPSSFITYLIIDTKKTRELNDIEHTASQRESSANNLKTTLDLCQKSVIKTVKELEVVKDEKNKLSEDIQNLMGANTLLYNEKVKIQHSNAGFQVQIKELYSQINHLETLKAELTERVEAWSSEFQNHVNLECSKIIPIEVEKIRQSEIQSIFEQTDSMIQGLIANAEGFQAWGQSVSQRHVQKSEFIRQLTKNFNSKIDGADQMMSASRDAYGHQIELLNEKVALLQRQLAGDLDAFIPKDFAYHTIGKIGNDIGKKLWEIYQIPLRIFGYEEHNDGTATAGYGFSKSVDPEVLVTMIDKVKNELVKELRIHSIDSVILEKTSPTILIKFRHVKPIVVKDDVIYSRLGLVKSHLYIESILALHNSDGANGSKPTLRIMGGTGGGKTLTAKLLADYYLHNRENWEVRFSDPQDGSSKDFWQSSKIARGHSEAAKAFKDFVKEFDLRTANKSPHAHIDLLGIFDEFDKEHSDDDKEDAKRIWTAIRHRKMLMVLMGQSAQVGGNGWLWDDMKNCTMLFIGDATTTATGKYKELGLSLKLKNQIQKEYETISEWMTDKNLDLSETPERQYRVALLLSGTKYKFLEIPPALDGALKNDKSFLVSKPWEFVSEMSIESTQYMTSPNTLGNDFIEAKFEDITPKVTCPHCDSEEITKNGTNTRGEQYYTCKTCDGKPRKWLLNNSLNSNLSDLGF